ncbi:MAG: T9SS type A sorting domain-containing protein, partial [Bacteroidota bacterium]
AVDYGNLTFTNGGATAKSINDDVTVNGNFLINSGATVNADSSNITLYGNFTNSGTFNAGTGTLILNGTSKTISGTNTFYNLDAITGSYTVSSGSTDITGELFVDTGGSLNFGSTNVTLDGDLTNKGSLTSSGIATFTGNQVQTIQLLNSITSSSTGVVNFNGTIPPVSNSTSSPTFATVNINNTGGIAPSMPWTVYFACNIATGATFDGGSLSHTFLGNFTNNGTVISSGELKFIPMIPFSAGPTIKLDGVSFISTGKVEFGGSVPITIIDNSPSFNMVYVTNSDAAGITPPNGWIIADQLYIGPGATFKGGTALSHTLASDLTNNGTLDGGTSAITFTGNPVAINGLGTSTFYNLTIASGADVSLNRGISISKDFVDDGAFDATGRTVKFTGTTASTISGTTSPVIFDDLEQIKTVSTATTTLNVPVTVTSSLTMSNGIINSSAISLLTLADDVTATPGNDTSFIDGPLRKAGNDAFTFPIGNGGYFHPVSISAPTFSSDEFTAQYVAANPDPFYSVYSKDLSLDHLSTCEYWKLDRINGTSDVNVTLSWDTNSCGVNYLADLRVAQWNGTMWKDFGNSGTTGTTSSGTVTSAIAVTTYGPFTLGSPTTNNPLPVGLLGFTATPQGNHIAIDWSTSSETNNDYFTIEKSDDALRFEKLATVKGAGNSTERLKYNSTDEHPFMGTSYYRLKQTDFNGKFKYSQIATVTVTESEDYSIFPNPSNISKTYVTIRGTANEKVTIKVYDNIGKQAYSKTSILEHSGESTIAVEPTHKLVRGIYTVMIIAGENLFNHKLVIN